MCHRSIVLGCSLLGGIVVSSGLDRFSSGKIVVSQDKRCSGTAGYCSTAANRFRIRRLEICGTDSTAVLLRKMKFGTNDGGLANAARYYASRLAGRLSG